MNLLFVCTGNTCRSPMAEHLAKHLLKQLGRTDVQVHSAGVAPATWLGLPNEAAVALAREGVSDLHHAAQPLSDDLVEQADLILVMEERHRQAVIDRFPGAAAKTRLLDEAGIADPYGQSQEAYDRAFARIKAGLQKWLPTL